MVAKPKTPAEDAAPSMYREDDSDDSELSETERRKASVDGTLLPLES